MELSVFLNLFRAPKKIATPQNGLWESAGGVLSENYQGIPWEVRRLYAEKVAQINFGCDFHNGECIAERRDIHRPTLQGVNFCCSTCKDTVGNLYILPAKVSYLTSIAEVFDKDTGFWKSGFGCSLEPMYRSTQCLVYRCDFLKGHFPLSRKDLLAIYQLSTLKRKKKCQ